MLENVSIQSNTSEIFANICMAFHIVNKQKDATFHHSTKPFIAFAIENEVRSKTFEYDLYLFDIFNSF